MIGFQPQFLDFRRGIRVRNLEDHERITRLLKLALEHGYGQSFVTEAKAVSNQASFGCAKFFLMMDTEEERFKCGMQVERGYICPT